MNTKMYTISVISIIMGILSFIGGFIMTGYAIFFGSAIKDADSSGLEALFAVFGGIVWIAVAIISIVCFATGALFLASGILGVKQAKNPVKRRAIILIILHSVNMLGWVLTFFSLNPIGIAVTTVTILGVIFSAMDIKSAGKRVEFTGDEYNGGYGTDEYNGY